MEAYQVSRAIKDAYNRIQDILAGSYRAYGDSDTETLAVLGAISSYLFSRNHAQLDTAARGFELCVSSIEEIENLNNLSTRMTFYQGFIAGRQPIGQWLFTGNYGRDQAIMRAIAAYGDVLFDPFARINYDLFATVEGGFPDPDFRSMMLQKVIPEIQNMCQSLTDMRGPVGSAGYISGSSQGKSTSWMWAVVVGVAVLIWLLTR